MDSSEFGAGLLRAVSVALESAGETVGSRDGAEETDDGEGERKRPASGGSLNCSSPDVRSGYRGLLLLAAIEDDEASEESDGRMGDTEVRSQIFQLFEGRIT